METVHFAALAAAAGLAAFVQAATGFGFALLAVPVFLAVMDSLAAVQVTAAVSVVLSAVLMPWLAGAAPGRLLAHLVAGSIIGFPVGLSAFRAADVAGMKLTVGVLIAGFVIFLLVRERRTRAEGPGGAEAETGDFAPRAGAEIAVGTASGAMAAALAMPGPPVVLYLLMRRAGKTVSRAATLILFAFSYAAVTALHALWGGMPAAGWLLAAGLAPFVIAGAVAGHFATRFLSETRFRVAVLAILLASGLYAAASALAAFRTPAAKGSAEAAASATNGVIRWYFRPMV